MTTYIHHDEHGNIKGAVVFNGGDKAGMMLTPKAGVLVSKVEGLEFKSDRPSHQEIRDILKGKTIELGNTTLTKNRQAK